MTSPDKLRTFIEESGLSYHQNSCSYVFDCPRCNKKDKAYLRKRDGKFICFYCAAIDGYRGRPEYLLADLCQRSLKSVQDALYGTAAATDVDYFDLAVPDFFGEDDEVDVEAITIPTMVYPHNFYDITHPFSKKGLEYINSRGISTELATEYGLRYAPKDQRVIFPVEIGPRLVGWQARTIKPNRNWSEEKQDFVEFPKMLSSKEVPTAHTVMFSNRLVGSEHAVITEGPIDAIKCFAPGTGILMADLSVRAIESLRQGDKVMGPDSLPRTVQHTSRSYYEKRFRISPREGGIDWICNINHDMFVVKRPGYPQVKSPLIIELSEFLEKSKNFRLSYGLSRSVLDFEDAEQTIPPYILGVWLGDGDSARACLTSMDEEISSEWIKWIRGCDDYVQVIYKDLEKCKRYSASPYRFEGDDVGVFRRVRYTNSGKLLRSLNLINNKHIPANYMMASKLQRLELLAGLIDTDGCLVSSSRSSGFRWTQSIKRREFTSQVAILARTLGFRVCESRSWSVSPVTGNRSEQIVLNISGDTTQIPVRVTRKRATADMKEEATVSGFDISAIEDGEVIGVQVDGDNLFLLGDCTIVHNCHLTGGNIATMGKAIGPGQTKVIRDVEQLMRPVVGTLTRSGIKRVYLALDDDAANETTRLIREFSDIDVYVMHPPAKYHDLGEMSLHEVKDLFDSAPKVSTANLFVHFNAR